MTIDMIFAIARPSYSSRTMATATIRGAAAPSPCSTRPASITAQRSVSAEIRQPARNTP